MITIQLERSDDETDIFTSLSHAVQLPNSRKHQSLNLHWCIWPHNSTEAWQLLLPSASCRMALQYIRTKLWHIWKKSKRYHLKPVLLWTPPLAPLATSTLMPLRRALGSRDGVLPRLAWFLFLIGEFWSKSDLGSNSKCYFVYCWCLAHVIHDGCVLVEKTALTRFTPTLQSYWLVWLLLQLLTPSNFRKST